MRVVPLRSIKDPLFKHLRELRTAQGRAASGSFLIEDADSARLASEAGCELRAWLASEAVAAEPPPWLAALPTTVHVAHAGLLRKLFPTGKAPELVAECRQLGRPIDSLGPSRRVLVLEHIQDAGNLGSMLRTAEGLGVRDVVVLRSEVTDLYSRVAVRASMGSMFRVRLYEGELDAVVARLAALGVTLVSTTPHTDQPLSALAVDRPLALAVGNETLGASEALLAASGERVRIEMAGEIESLNVGAACAIALYVLGSGDAPVPSAS